MRFSFRHFERPDFPQLAWCSNPPLPTIPRLVHAWKGGGSRRDTMPSLPRNWQVSSGNCSTITTCVYVVKEEIPDLFVRETLPFYADVEKHVSLSQLLSEKST